MYSVFLRMLGESYRRRLVRSLLTRDVFRVLIISLVCVCVCVWGWGGVGGGGRQHFYSNDSNIRFTDKLH